MSCHEISIWSCHYIVTVIGIFAVISLGGKSCQVGDQRLLWIGPQCCLSTEVDLELAARKLGHMLFYLSPKSGTQYKGSLVKYSTYWCTRFSVGMNWEWPPLRDSVFFEQLPRSYLADLGLFFYKIGRGIFVQIKGQASILEKRHPLKVTGYFGA